MTNWKDIFRLVEPTRPRPSRSKFRAKIQKVKQGKYEMTYPVLLLLELFDDSEVEYDGILSGDDDFFFQPSQLLHAKKFKSSLRVL